MEIWSNWKRDAPLKGTTLVAVLDESITNAGERNQMKPLDEIRNYLFQGTPVNPAGAAWVTKPTVSESTKTVTIGSGSATWDGVTVNYLSRTETVTYPSEGLLRQDVVVARKDGTFLYIQGQAATTAITPNYPSDGLWVAYILFSASGGKVQEPAVYYWGTMQKSSTDPQTIEQYVAANSTQVADSATNGNILIDGAEVNVYNDGAITTSLTNKVDKVTGKGLSSTDYTQAEKDKLAGLTQGSSTYLGLTDTPASYTGMAGKFFKVKADESGLEFADASTGGSTTNNSYSFKQVPLNGQGGNITNMVDAKMYSSTGLPRMCFISGSQIHIIQYQDGDWKHVWNSGAMINNISAIGYCGARKEVWTNNATNGTLIIVNIETATIVHNAAITGISAGMNHARWREDGTNMWLYGSNAATLYKVDAATRTVLATYTLAANIADLHVSGTANCLVVHYINGTVATISRDDATAINSTAAIGSGNSTGWTPTLIRKSDTVFFSGVNEISIGTGGAISAVAKLYNSHYAGIFANNSLYTFQNNFVSFFDASYKPVGGGFTVGTTTGSPLYSFVDWTTETGQVILNAGAILIRIII